MYYQNVLPITKPLLFIGRLVNRKLKQSLYSRADNARWIKNEIVQMGSAYIKMGQLVASRSDIFEKEYIQELQDLHDNVDPINFDTIYPMLVNAYDTPNDIFSIIHETPIATASVGQVHKGTLRYNNNEVAIKIRKPNVIEDFTNDFDVMIMIMEFIKKCYPNSRKVQDLYEMIKMCSRNILKELDFNNERHNIKIMCETFAYESSIYIPRVYTHLSNESILVMEFIDCSTIHRIRDVNISNQLMRVMIMKGINNGYIHGDLHRGNIGLQLNEYGEYRFILFDFGLILKLDKRVIHQLLYALSFNDVDIIVKVLLHENVIITIDDDYDNSVLQLRKIAVYVKEYLQHLDIMRLIDDIKSDPYIDIQMVKFRLNENYFLISRTLTLLEGTCKGLSDDFSYVNTMIQGILDININMNMLIDKVKFDFEHLTQTK
jgi:ubiquinone biosynthesis protein